MKKLLIGLLTLTSVSSFAIETSTCAKLEELLTEYTQVGITPEQFQLLQKIQQIYALNCIDQQQQNQSGN